MHPCRVPDREASGGERGDYLGVVVDHLDDVVLSSETTEVLKFHNAGGSIITMRTQVDLARRQTVARYPFGGVRTAPFGAAAQVGDRETSLNLLPLEMQPGLEHRV
jgi:hypothetical protein